MCLNCGCGKPDDDHGITANITADDLQRAGAANGQSLRTSAQNILDTVDAMAGDRQAVGASPMAGTGTTSQPAERGTPATES